MERRVINPWQWQDALGYAQAVEVAHGQRVLYCAGRAALDALAPDNLEAVLRQGGYAMAGVVRLN